MVVWQIEEKDVELREMNSRLEGVKSLHELRQSVDWDQLVRLVDSVRTAGINQP